MWWYPLKLKGKKKERRERIKEMYKRFNGENQALTRALVVPENLKKKGEGGEEREGGRGEGRKENRGVDEN